MKNLLAALIFFALAQAGWAQAIFENYQIFGLLEPKNCNYWAIESKEWVLQKVENQGKPDCDHNFVQGERYRTHNGVTCAVMHYGSHCSWNDDWRDQICRKCGRLEKYEEIWNEKWVACPEKPKSEFELLRDSFTQPMALSSGTIYIPAPLPQWPTKP